MPRYEIFFYTDSRGERPFALFLEALPLKVQVKFTKLLELLGELGPNLKRPYADVLRDGIRELRCVFGGDQYRALYFFVIGQRIIVTHGVVKKTWKVPHEEIERALRCKREYENSD